MKVKIKTRQVYHKMLEVTVDVPSTLKPYEIRDYLIGKEEDWIDNIDELIYESDFIPGLGLDEEFVLRDQATEWIYEVNQTHKGHL